jgi:dihydropyrimidinase
MTLLIKNGTIVTATDQYRGDVFVDAETITTIGINLTMSADRVIDATDRYLFPGGIDVHTHLDMPFGGTTSADDFESGTIAAAYGGTTTIVDFAIQYKGQTLHHAWETWMKKADGKAAIDYGFHMIVTDLTEQVEQEMDDLVKQGVTSFKLFMAYPGVFMLDDASIFRALLRTGKNGGTICMHAENGGVIDVLVKRALAEGRTARSTTRSRGRRGRRPKPHIVRLPWPKSPTYRFTSSTSRPLKRSRWWPKRETAACRPMRRRVRSTCFSRTTTTRSPDSTAPSTS